MKSRIVKIGDKYVVQTREFLFFWRGVDTVNPYYHIHWHEKQFQFEYCSHNTLEEARVFRDKFCKPPEVIE